MLESMTVDTSTRAEESLAVLQAVADPVRWSVLESLTGNPRCVCDIQERVPVAANLLSYHLKVLRDAGLVTATRRGRWMDYALAPGSLARMQAALPGGLGGDEGGDAPSSGRCGR